MSEIQNPRVAIIDILKLQDSENIERKNQYLKLLEDSEDTSLFKSNLLFNTAALDSYITQSRVQAQESFEMAKRVCYIGFAIIGIGILLGLISPFIEALDDSYISLVTTASGVITELISATIFVLHGKTLQQFNSSLDKISESQKTAMEIVERQYGK